MKRDDAEPAAIAAHWSTPSVPAGSAAPVALSSVAYTSDECISPERFVPRTALGSALPAMNPVPCTCARDSGPQEWYSGPKKYFS